MSNAALVQDETEDRYFTQVEEGDVRLFTLDQLDAAFNAGLIHENTYLCLEGDSKWLTLAEVAGLGDSDGDEEPVSAPHLIAAPAPVAPQAPAPVQRQHAPVAYASSDPFGMAPVTSSVAPVMNSIAPVANSVAPRSFAPPVSTDLDDDFEMMAMRRKRPLGKILAGVAVLGMAGVAFAVVSSGGVRLPKLGENVAQASAATLSVSNLKAAEPAHTEAPAAPAPAPVAAAEAPKTDDAKPADAADGAKKTGEDRFSEEMKAALLNKDKSSTSSKKTSKKAGRAVAAASHKTAGKASKG